MARFIKKIALALFYILVYFAFLYILSGQVMLLEEDAENYREVVTILAALASMGIYLVVLYLRGIRLKSYVRFKSITLIDAALALTLALGFRTLTGAYLMWSEESVPLLQQSIENAQRSYNFNTMTTVCAVSVVLSVCVVAPFFEEFLFRGMVMKELSGAMPGFFAVLLQALLFGLAHTALVQAVFSAVYAVILGAVYLKSKNISIVILSHMFFNMSSALEVKNADMVTQMFVSGLVLTGVSVWFFFYIYGRKKPAQTGEITGGNNDV